MTEKPVFIRACNNARQAILSEGGRLFARRWAQESWDDLIARSIVTVVRACAREGEVVARFGICLFQGVVYVSRRRMRLLKSICRSVLDRILGKLGYRLDKLGRIPADADETERRLVRSVDCYTMTPVEARLDLLRSVKYILDQNIPGAFVECGVWRGGSMMLVAGLLQQFGISERELYLFDTFSGMTPPTDYDKTWDGRPVAGILEATPRQPDNNIWCIASLEEVRNNLAKTKYSVDRLHLVVGPVEKTIPSGAPVQIALLRLDTDWYESTSHELNHLYPRLQQGGVLIIDDYGAYQGARKAVDEYFSRLPRAPMLHRITGTVRAAIKP
jgi:O-methyltransferase